MLTLSVRFSAQKRKVFDVGERKEKVIKKVIDKINYSLGKCPRIKFECEINDVIFGDELF